MRANERVCKEDSPRPGDWRGAARTCPRLSVTQIMPKYLLKEYLRNISNRNILAIFVWEISAMQIAIRTATQLAQVLLSARKAQGITQSQAAAEIGVQQPRLSALETTSTASLSLEQMLVLFSLYRLELLVQTRDSDDPARTQLEW